MKEEYIGFIETKDGELYIVRRGNKLIAGTACNVGLLESDSMEIDSDFSDDENLRAFVGTLLEKYGEYTEE